MDLTKNIFNQLATYGKDADGYITVPKPLYDAYVKSFVPAPEHAPEHIEVRFRGVPVRSQA